MVPRLRAAFVCSLTVTSMRRHQPFPGKGQRMRHASVALGDVQSSRQRARLEVGGSTLGDNNPDANIEDDWPIPVRIFDDVFSPDACDEIHDLAADHQRRGNDGSSIFVRPSSMDDTPEGRVASCLPLTPLEHAMDSVLTALGDTSAVVEYWSRREHINIDTHADIDERALIDQSTLRCPGMGHILYLRVGPEVKGKGPTCVFPSKCTGWGKANDEDTGILKRDHDVEEGTVEVVDFVTVPAVAGRLLRFDGSAMHAVPCPATRWLLSDEEERELRRKEEEAEYMYEDLLDDDYDDDVTEVEDDQMSERSVLLFNTWPEGPPPKGVDGDPATGALPSGIELDEDEEEEGGRDSQTEKMAAWREKYGENASDIRCRDRSLWKENDLLAGGIASPLEPIKLKSEGEEEACISVRVSLMGNRSRRLHPKRTARLVAPDTLRDALERSSTATKFRMVENDVRQT